ncbi:MAG TPA: hypothetical protein VMR80_15510 [Candidatus Acidoferrum sp.]|nr:hypothetical protein [Candidatus Acidoferrum sp.]
MLFFEQLVSRGFMVLDPSGMSSPSIAKSSAISAIRKAKMDEFRWLVGRRKQSSRHPDDAFLIRTLYTYTSASS